MSEKMKTAKPPTPPAGGQGAEQPKHNAEAAQTEGGAPVTLDDLLALGQKLVGAKATPDGPDLVVAPPSVVPGVGLYGKGTRLFRNRHCSIVKVAKDIRTGAVYETIEYHRQVPGLKRDGKPVHAMLRRRMRRPGTGEKELPTEIEITDEAELG